MSFQGFRDESFLFFRELAANNHRLWFEAREKDFEELILEPFRELRDDLAPFMEELHPGFAPPADTERQLSRIELTADPPPEGPHYKTSLYCFWWNQELPRLADAHLHVGLGGEGVTIGFSIYDWAHDHGRMRELFRPRMRNELNLLDEYIKSSYLRRGFEFRRFERGAGRLGLREADPFPSRGDDWDGTLGWVVSRQIKEGSSRLTPGSFVTECKTSFERLLPLYIFASDERKNWREALRDAS
jgi:hypothetical protein